LETDEKRTNTILFISFFVGIVLIGLVYIIFTKHGFNISGVTHRGKIQRVTNGTLKFDKSLTVGEAFKAYKYFKHVDWSYYKDEQGREIVEATAIYDLANNNMQDKQCIDQEPTHGLPTELLAKYGFVLHKNDKGIGVQYEKYQIKYSDGTIINPKESFFSTIRDYSGTTNESLFDDLMSQGTTDINFIFKNQPMYCLVRLML
jgi:hypothetical protein